MVWVLQVVQLPLLRRIGPGEFAEYARGHRRRNTMLMALPMAVELATAIWLWIVVPLVLLAVIWIVTFVWYVPHYARLTRGYNAHTVRCLIGWNWVRTICWSARAAILLWLASHFA